MKTKPTDDTAGGRRDFLRRLGAGTAGGAAAAAMAPFAGGAAQAAESQDEARKPRYDANSPDVKNYYRVNSYPTR